MADYKINSIYQGSYSTFKSTPFSSGNYPITTGSLGLTTDPRTANVLKEVSDKLSSGTKQIEIEAVSQDYLDKVSKRQLEEVKRLSKLTGVDISVHGPVMDTTGVDPRRGGYSEAQRVLAEKKVLQTLERSHEINPQGNIPVNFHSAEGLAGSQFGPKLKEGERDYQQLIAVNRETGRMAPLEASERFYPGGKEGEVRIENPDPLEELKILNSTEWDNSISQLIFNKERADELLKKSWPLIEPVYEKLAKNEYSISDLPRSAQDAFRTFSDANVYLNDLHKNVNGIFNKAYKYGDDDQKRKLDGLSKTYAHLVKENPTPVGHSNAMHFLLSELSKPDLVPEMNVPVEDFAIEKSSQTYGNAAYEAYKKYGGSTPILNIENPPAGFALSTGEDVKRLVQASREEFIKKAIADKKNPLSEKEARKQADKIIGATLDVGHMNMLRKFGYSEKDIVEQSEKLKPILKHLHLSDNFGFEHTELPMGMGNVPFKKIMDKLGKEGYDARKIVEASVWWTDFRTSPFQASLETIGPGVYSGAGGPSWSQNAGFHQDYFGGYGSFLPQTNYELFGTNFSRLPGELGGARAGAGNRMGGRPME